MIQRDFQDKYFKIIDESIITALIGPRRSGKSTFVEEYLKTKNTKNKYSSVYFNFDQLSTREEIAKYGIEELIQIQLSSGRVKNKVLIFIDEAQKEPLVFEQIKIIYDKQKREKNKKYKFILTGSASLSIHKEISESLAGRVELLRVAPFTLSEIVRIKNISFPSNIPVNSIFNPKTTYKQLLKEMQNLSLLTSTLKRARQLINEVIEYGALPEIFEREDIEQKQRYLINYKDTYLEKDIRGEVNIGDLKSYSNLLTLLASQTGSLIVKKILKEKVGIAYNTLDRYLSVLNSTYILNELEPYIFSASRRLVKSSKCYFFDNGLLALLTGFLTFDQLLSTGLVGNRFENMVINEIIKKVKPYFPIADFYFWRSSSGKEVDLIVDFKEKVIPCEIKWTSNFKQVEINSLVSFLNDYKSADYGVVIYNGDFFLDKENKIFYLPITHFLGG